MVNGVKNSSIKKYCFYARLHVLLILMGLSMPLMAAVEVKLDRNRIVEGETVTLTFRTDDARQNLDADFSVIEKDFEILDRRSETQLSIVNGRQTAVVRLLLTIEPRRSGELVIPALNFGKSSTAPMVLRVDPAPELEPGELPPVFIEVELSPENGPYYVHAQFGLIVRVFYQQNLTEAAISQPEPSPASVRLLQETPYQAERGGERYRVLERNYAVFPERSGELTIPSMQLSGRLVGRRTSGAWQPTVRGRRVKVESDVLRLTIQPRPAEFSGSNWQPARDLKLSQHVSSSDSLRVGEPVTRTVMIDAVGLEENMIAEPDWPEIPGARIYPDKPQGITRDDGRWTLGHKEFRYAVVPEKEGELVLPELKVDWWDTVNGRQRTAVLPAHTLLVAPSVLIPPPGPAPVSQTKSTEPAATARQALEAGSQSGYWRWLTLLFAGLWLATLFVVWRLNSRPRGKEFLADSVPQIPENEAGILGILKRACERQDRAEARRAFQGWLREFGPCGDSSLFAFASGLGDGPLKHSVQAMDSDGYRQDTEVSWQGKAFWSQFDSWRKNQRISEQINRPAVTDLYAPENRLRR